MYIYNISSKIVIFLQLSVGDFLHSIYALFSLIYYNYIGLTDAFLVFLREKWYRTIVKWRTGTERISLTGEQLLTLL